MSIYEVEIDGSIEESKSTDAVLKESMKIGNMLQKSVGKILDHYDSDLKLATFGDLSYGAIFFHLIENEALSDLMPIEGETVGE